jgi:hypothetical protein
MEIRAIGRSSAMGGRDLFLAELRDVEEWPSTIAEPDVPFVVSAR